ncbi:MAG: hypothetical protein QOF84_4184 [Streptomyces sp.]|jgi:hypothetical protein|nr:hypothetical protein [Streptomyces sp.]
MPRAAAAIATGPLTLLVIAGGTDKHAPHVGGSTHVAADSLSDATSGPAPSPGGFGWSSWSG